MKVLEKNNFPVSAALLIIYTVFFVSVFFSLRAITSISIGVLLITGIVKQKEQIISAIRNNKVRLLLAAGFIFFLLQVFSLLYTDNIAGTWQDIQRKSGLTLIPLAVILTGSFSSGLWKTLFMTYCLALLAASVYCLFMVFIQYGRTGDDSVFFYHQLVSPVHQHAVYFSIFVFVGLVLLLENMQKKFYVGGYIVSLSIIIFFSGFLFLLSSRLVISFYVLYLLYYLVSLTNIFPRRVIVGLMGLVLIAVSLIFLTRNPIRERFLDLANGNLALVKQDKYTPGDYFNGIQFRLLQWKFVPEILNQHKSWWKGVGAANAQPFLNQEYISKNMYLGDPATGNIGYRAYNNHNQLLESLLSYGIPGLLSCLFILFALVKIIWQKKSRDTSFIITLLLVYAMIESVFETQYGIVLFVFFPSFLCQYDPGRANPKPAYPDLT